MNPLLLGDSYNTNLLGDIQGWSQENTAAAHGIPWAQPGAQ